MLARTQASQVHGNTVLLGSLREHQRSPCGCSVCSRALQPQTARHVSALTLSVPMQPTLGERCHDMFTGCFGCCLPSPPEPKRHAMIADDKIEQISQQISLEGL